MRDQTFHGRFGPEIGEGEPFPSVHLCLKCHHAAEAADLNRVSVLGKPCSIGVISGHSHFNLHRDAFRSPAIRFDPRCRDKNREPTLQNSKFLRSHGRKYQAQTFARRDSDDLSPRL